MRVCVTRSTRPFGEISQFVGCQHAWLIGTIFSRFPYITFIIFFFSFCAAFFITTIIYKYFAFYPWHIGVTQYEPVFTAGSQPFVHHMNVYECVGDPSVFEVLAATEGSRCYQPSMPPLFFNCNNVVVAWTAGSEVTNKASQLNNNFNAITHTIIPNKKKTNVLYPMFLFGFFKNLFIDSFFLF